MFFFKNGQLHRIDGPACEYADGSKRWYVKNKELTKKQIKKLQELRRVFNDDELLNELLLSGRLVL